ncbi:sigma-70 family RNA polymerase sigma factor [Microbacterium sp. LTA6]|uniref:RNA polymerase sigma factor n=1 Tax=unclassified Microbacterium TaxID=2609290 RepID=UPI00313A08B7
MVRAPVPQELHDWIAIVVDENADGLLRYFRRRVNLPEDAADLLGLVLLALWESGTKVPSSDTDARMWCFGIARNVLREHYRSAAKRLALADELRDHLRVSPLHDNAADSVVEANMRAETARNAIKALNKRSRELVMLIHWDGFSIAEAARLLSINDSTARTRYARALQRLKRDLSEHPLHDEAAGARSQPSPATGAR